VKELPPEIEAVGVFVNAAAADAANAVANCSLHRVQFHGNEPVNLLVEFHRRSPHTPIVRAWRYEPGNLSALTEYLSRCAAAHVPIDAVMIDAHVPGEYGGTGRALPWQELRRESAALALPRWILAGGLTAQNVESAIDATLPWGVDVASGVESSSGVKDFGAVARFIQAARAR
jgi:phosphoribosylanthranilate isomerase